METSERLENNHSLDCPTSEEPSKADESSENIDDARVRKLKLLESTICVICYSSVKAKSFPCSCLHIFCFHCLVKWSKQKNQCPLCKKGFDAIIHNVRSKTEYDKYQVVPPEPSDSPIINLTDLSIPIIPIELNSVYHRVNFLTTHGQPRRRFTYRTRFEADPLQITRIQELFGSENYTRLTPAEWRKNVYDRRLFALPLPDLTGRFRDCSPEFYRENPAQTHRLIPWLNRELVVLMPQNNINAIPQILEDMRENLCLYDIQSIEIRNYFRRYLQERADHFVHEFYSFAISPYDIVGYDRHVDYSSRESEDATVEISSNESSDSEVQVIDDTSADRELNGISERASDEIELSVNLEVPHDISENVPATEVIVESDSDSSEVLFVLALKPPEQRTPEQVFLDSASDSDVEFVPNSPLNHQLNTPRNAPLNSQPKSNKTLPETRRKLKAEVKQDIASNDVQIDENLLNIGASTSTASQGEESVITHRKFYYHPIRKRTSGKSIFDSSSSTDSSSEEWKLQSSRPGKKYSKSSKTRRKSSKILKKKINSSTTASSQKLSMLPSSEEAKDEEKTISSIEHPRMRRVEKKHE